MPQELVLAGIILLFIALVLIIVGSVLSAEKEERKIEVGIGGFIGPVPFGWASSPDMLKWIMVITAIVMIGFVLLTLFK